MIMLLLMRNWRMTASARRNVFVQVDTVWLHNLFLWRPEKFYAYRHCIQIQSSIITKFMSLNFPVRYFSVEHDQSSFNKTNDDMTSTSSSVSLEIEKGSHEHFEKISKLLDCTVEEVEALSQKYKFLNDINLDLMQQKVQIVLSYGLPPTLIYENIRLVRYVSANELQRRLKLLKKYSLLHGPFVGFRLHCHARVFVAGFENWHQNQIALEGCANHVEYIQHRLKCNESEAKELLSSSTFAKGYSSRKLRKQLDYILDEAGLSAQFLMRNPKLLAYSTERLRYRIGVMNEADIIDPSSRRKFFYCTTKEFNEVFRARIKALENK